VYIFNIQPTSSQPASVGQMMIVAVKQLATNSNIGTCRNIHIM